MPPKKTVKQWSLERKKEILRAFKVKRRDTSLQKFSDRYGLSKNTLYDWRQREAKGEFGPVEDGPVATPIPPPTSKPRPQFTQKEFNLPPNVKLDEARLRHFRTACEASKLWADNGYDTSLVASELSLTEDQVFQMINEVMRSAPTMFDLSFSPAPIVVKGCDCPERMKLIFDKAEMK